MRGLIIFFFLLALVLSWPVVVLVYIVVSSLIRGLILY